MSIEEIKKRLQDMNLSKVAEKIGMHRETLSRLMRGDVSYLSHKNHVKLEKYFQERQ